jgi:hypothetical protein
MALLAVDSRPTLSRRDATKQLAFLTLLAGFLVWGGWRVMPWDKMFPDFISFWSAAKILVFGQSPYDVALQTKIQQAYGWDMATDGFGVYAFLPFYYPPWLGFLCLVLLPLGFEGAKLVWFFANVEMVLLTAYLLRLTVRDIPVWAPYTFVPCFLFSLAAVLLGQTSILVLFLTALAWALLERHWDWSAGFVLAWLSIKPQLTVLLIVAVLIWLLRKRRYQAVIAFLFTSALLAGISSLVLPGWLPAMINAPRITPSPTEHYPWIGNTWYLVLRSLGLQGAPLWIGYLLLAVPFLGLLLKAAATKSTPLENVVALAVLAAFFVAPYARHYDFPVLLIPLLLIGARERSVLLWAILVLGFLVIPYAQMSFLTHLKATNDPGGKFLVECSYFWVPIATLAGWILLIRKPPTATPNMASKTAQVA